MAKMQVIDEDKYTELVNSYDVMISPLSSPKSIYKDAKQVIRKLDGKQYQIQPIKTYFVIFSTSQLRFKLADSRLPDNQRKAIEKILIERGALKKGK